MRFNYTHIRAAPYLILGSMATGSTPGAANSISSQNSKRIMEGPLCKWTNVVHGWQYRWFVLDKFAGLLSYYTVCAILTCVSVRPSVRLAGCVRACVYVRMCVCVGECYIPPLVS